jgi:hypothetical protein
MLLDTTTDSIEVKLAAAHTTRALQFFASYHIMDSNNVTFTPTKNFGSTNGTTAVTVVPAPTSAKINQLRSCSVYNCDSVEHTVTIQVNSSSNLRTVYSVIVKVGEQIQFTLYEGWKIFNVNGILKTFNSVIGGAAVKMGLTTNISSGSISSTQTSGTTYAYYLGKADRNYNSVTVQITVSVTALGATITYAEAAIYKGYPSIASNLTLTRCGFVDVSTGTNHGINTTGNKTIVIPITDNNLFFGDEIWFVLGTLTSGTNVRISTTNVLDNIGCGMVQTATGSLRPSTNSSISFTLATGVVPLCISWHGAQSV